MLFSHHGLLPGDGFLQPAGSKGFQELHTLTGSAEVPGAIHINHPEFVAEFGTSRPAKAGNAEEDFGYGKESSKVGRETGKHGKTRQYIGINQD